MNDETFPIISLDDQIRAVQREIDRRRRSYPTFIAEKRMLESAARHEIACMESILATLTDLKENTNA